MFVWFFLFFVFFWFKTLSASTIAGGQKWLPAMSLLCPSRCVQGWANRGPANTRGKSCGSGGHHSALSDGDHRSWHCPRHMDPDGDATSRNPTTGVRACIYVWGGEGRGICQYQRGTGWEERGEFSFWFLVNVKEREGSHG